VEIPYTVQARPDTGLNNGKLGIWLFLASEVMLFGALFATYIMLRVGAGDAWPDGRTFLDIPKATANTMVLIASSVTMVMAWAGLVKKNLNMFRLFMTGTVVLGAVFMAIKYFEYSHKLQADPPMLPSTNTFLAIYFTMTGLHAFHVLGGMCLNSYFLGKIPGTLVSLGGMVLIYKVMLIPMEGVDIWLTPIVEYGVPVLIAIATFMLWRFNDSAERWRSDPQWFTNRVEHAGLFWHFVDLVWIFLFPVFYLL
jgi:heme/copper-type cytochrome/quinol oxidase subunit 3